MSKVKRILVTKVIFLDLSGYQGNILYCYRLSRSFSLCCLSERPFYLAWLETPRIFVTEFWKPDNSPFPVRLSFHLLLRSPGVCRFKWFVTTNRNLNQKRHFAAKPNNNETGNIIICTELPTDGVKMTKRYSKLCHQNRWKPLIKRSITMPEGTGSCLNCWTFIIITHCLGYYFSVHKD